MHLNQLAQSKPFFKLLSSLSFLLLATLSSVTFSIEKVNPLNPESRIEDWHSFNINTVNNYIIPAYENLDKSSQLLNASIDKLCLQPKNSPELLNQAREAFHQTMDSWQFIQNIQFGPIQTLMRNYSMQFWPDKKNHVGKHLDSLLETNDPATLSVDEFHKASVSIKGLPAIERFLFEKNQLQELQNNPFHCQVLQRISSYTANTGHALVVEWQDMKNQFSNVSEDGYYESDIDASTALLKALVEPIEVIRDLKLLRPLGSEFGQQKMKRLESWRSQRSLRNIQMNIESLNQFYTHLSKLVDTTENALINDQFKKTLLQISTIKSPIESSIKTETGFQDINNLSDSLKTLHVLLENAVTNQGMHLGFNSRDGD
tara:strand:+ start:1603 stop:2721 length:1119 start_codon:yes stop_codon:yes gene_type:complete